MRNLNAIIDAICYLSVTCLQALAQEGDAPSAGGDLLPVLASVSEGLERVEK